MAKIIYSQLVLVILSSFLLTSVVSLNCYVCESCTEADKPRICTRDLANSLSVNPVANATIIPAPALFNGFVCQNVTYEDGDKKTTVRRCNYKVQELCKFLDNKLASSNYKNVKCQVCDTDGCNNRSGAITMWMPLLVAMIVISFFGTIYKR